MEGFIDIHSHILPGLDDGSNSMEQTIRMLKIAYSEGIRTIIATPHYREGHLSNRILVLMETLEKVKEAIANTDWDIRLFLGSEVYFSFELIKRLEEKTLPTLAGSRYILLEFSPSADYRYMKTGLQEILLKGHSPVLAHAERYEAFADRLEGIEELTDMGVYIQVNAMSILGNRTKTCVRTARRLLKNNLIHTIATDAHSDGLRAPKLKDCYSFISKKFGETYAAELFIGNQKKMIKNVF